MAKPIEYTPVTAYGETIPRDQFPDFVTDLARLDEDVITRAFLMDKWSLCPFLDMPAVEKNPILQRMVRFKKHARALNGEAGLEKARVKYADAVDTAAKVMDDKLTPAKVKIDAAKEIRQMAGFLDPSERAAMGGEKFTLTIIVGDTSTEIGGPVIENSASSPSVDASNTRIGMRDATPAERNLRPLDAAAPRSTLEFEEQLNSSGEAFSFSPD